ncbi:MAG: AAA family ATPase [Roseburia sp.]
MEERTEKLWETAKTLQDAINEVFVGKEDVVENVLICLFAGGHILLEDAPGTGKTTLARVLAQTVSCSFGRVQFTPDTLPGDVVGVSVYNMKTGVFEFREGAVMHQILLADEINRTAPKTQASLLEAMAEGQVTVDGCCYPLPQPFLVLATQNPVEYLGTYPLPEAQLDRFMMRLSIGYPKREQELTLARNFLEGRTPDTVRTVCGEKEVLAIRKAVAAVSVTDLVLGYMEEIIELTRREESFSLGASPRALLALIRASQARAFLQGKEYVRPDDVKAVAPQVLCHRLTLTPEAKMKRDSVEKIMRSILGKAKVPV